MGRSHCCVESRLYAEADELTNRHGATIAQLARPVAKLVAAIAQRPRREAGVGIVRHEDGVATQDVDEVLAGVRARIADIEVGQTVGEGFLGQTNEEAGLVAVFGEEFVAVVGMNGLAVCEPGLDGSGLVLGRNGGEADVVRKGDGKWGDE